jgi:SAM-dependent methyltransferase
MPKFVYCDINQLPDHLSDMFDIVFTSYGVLHWLPDLHQWGRIIAHFLKPKGIFYIVEDHPAFRMLTTEEETGIKLANPYFYSEIPDRVEAAGSYATDNQGETASYYLWNHGIGEVINAVIEAGLTIEFLHEFPYAARAKFPFMEQGSDGWWRLPSQYIQIPFLFSLQARKSRPTD